MSSYKQKYEEIRELLIKSLITLDRCETIDEVKEILELTNSSVRLIIQIDELIEDISKGKKD